MIDLAIDGSGPFLDLTLFDDNEPVYSLYTLPKKTHSQLFVDIIDGVLKTTNLSLSDIDRLYCVSGPGRHTSIRVIIASLKGLFFQKSTIDCFRVNALDLTAVSLIANGVFRVVGELFSKEAYFADYEKTDSKIERLNEPRKAKEEEIYKTDLEIFKANEVKMCKTKYIHEIEPFLERVNLFDLNPIY